MLSHYWNSNIKNNKSSKIFILISQHCSQYVRELELNFWLERSERYQLLLSTIKQVRATDLLDALPLNSSVKRIQILTSNLMIYLLILIIYRRISN
ncbi:unnamed protein product [Meloidogyne enterolobii]|uniref:Uncharacterized protein n=1 Tax=Meloidogyne enterolobii TaxID=390850 RepID=A0ACB0Y7C5_MELEN